MPIIPLKPSAADTIRIVIVIPTYNNGSSIATVVPAAQEQVPDVIVVNDGSTDRTAHILAGLPAITVVPLSTNRGKGCALQAGFNRALELGFTHAITMDGDGQHIAQDIPLFINKITESPATIWIGNRVIPYGGVPQPKRSRIGKNIGTFWYRFNTGILIEDTQSGFRAYPLKSILSIGCKSAKYEYELELLTNAAWKGIPVKEIPIHILYLPQTERVSHFRPIRDFLRVGKINARSALIRIFMPWRFIDAPGSTVREKLYHLVLKEIKGGFGPQKSAMSLAIGVLFGLLPIHGFQVAGVLGISVIFRLSKLLCILGVSISSVPFLPFWIALGVGIGKVMFPSSMLVSLLATVGYHTPATSVIINIMQWGLGSTIMAVVLALATFVISYPLFLSFGRLREKNSISGRKRRPGVSAPPDA